MQRVVGVATLSSGPGSRAEALARALADRGDAVVLFQPPGGSASPDVETVTVGRGLSSPPRVREVARFAGALAGKALRRHLRRRFDTIVLQGGDEAFALLGAIPRLVGARVVLDLDGEGLGRTAGWAAAAASVLRSPALRLIDGAIASDELAKSRLKGAKLDPTDVARLDPTPVVLRRSKQPRMTVKTPLRVLTRLEHLHPEGRALALKTLELVHERVDRFEVRIEGRIAEEVVSWGAQAGLPLAPVPRRGASGWAESAEDLHLALSVDESLAEVEPLLDFGLPTVRVRPAGRVRWDPLAAVLAAVGSDREPELPASILARLGRSSRERRELVRQGWAWVDEHGYAARTRRLFAAVDGPEDAPRARNLLSRGGLSRSSS